MSNSAIPSPSHAFHFPQQPAIVTSAVSNGITSLLQIGVDERFVLDIYLDAQQYTKIKNARSAKGLAEIQSPYRYLSRANGMTVEQLRVSAKALESTYNCVILSWGNIAPLTFLAEYHAYFHPGKNETGLENGMISQRLFATVEHESRMLLVDPSPSFLQHIASDEALCNRPITFAFSDFRRTAICRQHPWPQTISVIDADQLCVPNVQFRKACIMASTTEYSVTSDLLEKIRKATKDTIFLLAPTVFYDSKRKAGRLRRTIANDLDLRQIVLISYSLNDGENEEDDKKVKCCMLVMFNRAPSGQDIYVEAVTLQNGMLVATKPIRIAHTDFAECRLTLGAIYRQAKKVIPGTPKRNGTERLLFSREIVFWVRIETITKDGKLPKFRAIFRFYGFASEKQKTRNKYDRGQLISEEIGPTADSPAAALSHLDGIILPATYEEKHLPDEFAAVIRDTIEKHFGSNADLSLKTFWFQRLPELLQNAHYNHDLCCELFLGPQWDKNPLCNILVNDKEEVAIGTDGGVAQSANKSEAVRRALDDYAGANNVSSTKQALILEQLHLIWQYYVQKHPKCTNPITPLVVALVEIDDTREEQREALALRAWTLEQMQALGNLISSEVDYKPMALAIKCKLILGLSSGELSALVIDSFLPNKNSLEITHCMPQTGSEPTEYETMTDRQSYAHIWRKRVLSVPYDLVEELKELVADNQKNLYDVLGIERKDTGPYPLFPSRSDATHPLLTRRINEQCAKLVNLLEIPPWVISCPEDGIETNLNEYGKDSWVSNWRYQARHTMKLDAGSVNYLTGVKPDMVTDGNYRDFGNKFQRRKFQLAHEFLLARIYYVGKTLDQTWQSILLRNQRRVIPYSPHSCANELVLTYDTVAGDEVELTINAPHGCYVDVRYE